MDQVGPREGVVEVGMMVIGVEDSDPISKLLWKVMSSILQLVRDQGRGCAAGLPIWGSWETQDLAKLIQRMAVVNYKLQQLYQFVGDLVEGAMFMCKMDLLP